MSLLWLTTSWVCADESHGSMKNWKAHYAYGLVSELAKCGHHVYALANGALFSIDMNDGEMSYYSKMTGLSGATIAHIAYVEDTEQLLVAYTDGLIDLIDKNENIYCIQDLYLKQMNASKCPNSIYVAGNLAYFCMDFGIVVVRVDRREILDTYYIGTEGADVRLLSATCLADSIYALSEHTLYSASMADNLLDYSVWHSSYQPCGSAHMNRLLTYQSQLYIQADSSVYVHRNSEWQLVNDTLSFARMYLDRDQLFLMDQASLYLLKPSGEMTRIPMSSEVYAIYYESDRAFWLALGGGVTYWNSGATQSYVPNGPYVNACHRMRWQGDRMLMVPGGYWASKDFNIPSLMVYNNGWWGNYVQSYFLSHSDLPITDICDAIIDPLNENHFFVASYASGVIEFRDNDWYQIYTPDNSPLESCVASSPEKYTWIDAFAWDPAGNLYMSNANLSVNPESSNKEVKILRRNGSWLSVGNVATSNLWRARDILVWTQNPNIKIITDAGGGHAGLGVWDDNGTLEYFGDDRSVFALKFMDQDGKLVQPVNIYCIEQMADGEIWVGTNEGLFIIDQIDRLLVGDNSCRRVIIPRNDGTNLGDYLLGTERINAIREDGVGRKWIGTATSGLYLVSADGKETIEHFTTTTSPIPSDNIISLSIQSSTGEVFIGTGVGLVSYQSDASEPKEDFSELYVYPNPVRPGYEGYVTVSGLMNNSAVKIVDGGGNLVCETRSNGGLATWNLRTKSNTRVASGVYTIYCNSEDGGHAVTKVMVMH